MAIRELRVKQPAAAQCCVPLSDPNLSGSEVATTAALFKALADPARVRIINRLATSAEPVCVCDFTALLGLSQPTVSFHLKKLLVAGLVDREQRGAWAYFSLNRTATERLKDVFSF